MKLFKKWREKRRRKKLLSSLCIDENGEFICDFEKGGDLEPEDIIFMLDLLDRLVMLIREQKRENGEWD